MWSCEGDGLYPPSRRRPGSSGEGFTAPRPCWQVSHPSSGRVRLGEAGECHPLLGLRPLGRDVERRPPFLPYPAGPVVQPLQSVKPIAIVRVHWYGQPFRSLTWLVFPCAASLPRVCEPGLMPLRCEVGVGDLTSQMRVGCCVSIEIQCVGVLFLVGVLTPEALASEVWISSEMVTSLQYRLP